MTGIFCLGTNGEACILDMEEKVRVMQLFVEEAAGRVPVYAGTGCVGTKDTFKLSRKAQELGASALSVVSPYFAAINQQEFYEHYASVAQWVDLPVVL